jgi:hypothetical protein
MQREQERTRAERDILVLLASPERAPPFVVRVHAAWQDASDLALVLDYCPGGDMATQVRLRASACPCVCVYVWRHTYTTCMSLCGCGAGAVGGCSWGWARRLTLRVGAVGGACAPVSRRGHLLRR